MAKLHEQLAVESGLEKASKKLTDESIRTLSKDNLFKGSIKRLSMFNDEDKYSETEETQELTTTVDENLDYALKEVAKYWDVVLTKDATNQEARADIILENGVVLAKEVPATFLLGLESKLGNLRKLYDSIPTLAPGIKWQKDETKEKSGIFVNDNDVIAFKTRKEYQYDVAYEATKEHPAQVNRVEISSNIGSYATTNWCSMLTPLNKAERIKRLDEVISSVKRARMRANNIDIIKSKIGTRLFTYINTGN